MRYTISVKQAIDIDGTNPRYVTVKDASGNTLLDVAVHTDAFGYGIWSDGEQIAGTSQFHAGKDVSASYRRYFRSVYA